jgi:hypothetical protein
MWLTNVTATPVGSFYFFGDAGASFRCFTGGIAGNNNLMLRGTGLTDVSLSAVGSAPFVVHFVHETSPANVIKVYKNGVLSGTVAQAAPLNISGNGFRIGGYSTVSSLPSGCIMDEFRMYNRALTAAEVASTWNISLGTPLSLKSMELKGEVEGNAVRLSWQVAREAEVATYVAERSFDGRAFSMVQEIPKKESVTSYAVTDNDGPGVTGYDAIYYRVVAKELGGASSYSNVLRLALDRADAGFSISPNPFVDNLLITLRPTKSGPASVKLLDAQGRVVRERLEQFPAGKSEIKLAGLETLPAGTYQVIVEADGNKRTTTAMKLH